jgi:putative two-component system response regulator
MSAGAGVASPPALAVQPRGLDAVVDLAADSRSHLATCRILVIDDEPANTRIIGRILARAGFTDVILSNQPMQALALFQECTPDLVLLDLQMPGMDGFEVLEQLRTVIPPDTFLPILILTGNASVDARQRALRAGAKDFLLKPFDTMEVVLRIRNLLETRTLHLLLAAQNRSLETKVQERTQALNEAQVEMLQRLASTAEVRDDDTGQHTIRVGELAGRLARALGLPAHTTQLIRSTAPLHDLGKIGIPDGVLLKPGRLTPEEFDIMKGHTTIGARILSGGHSELLQVAERIALTHHERWDGSGYPLGLAGSAIPLEGRVVAVVDFWDALTHDRPYRGAVPVAEVLDMVRAGRGSHFDPEVADSFLALITETLEPQADSIPLRGNT